MGLNRIYKVIWSKTKGCYVVVSEMAKRVGRNKAKAIVMSTAAMAMAVAPAVMNVDRVEASVLIGATENDTTTATKINNQSSTVSPWGITIGGAISKAGDNSVHIGDATGSVGTRNVVIGTYATAGYDEKKPADNPAKDGSFNQSVAIGAGSAAGLGARAYGDQSIAIGSNTIARGNSSIAIGNDDVDKTETIMTTYTDLEGNRSTATIGTAYNKLTGKNLKWDGGQYADTSAGEAAVSIGVKAEAGDISLALGTAAKAKVVNGVAIGSGATADRDNAVAIGGGATTEKEGTKEINATIGDLNFTWKGGENTLAGDVVSFGKAGYERQLKNVAAGRVDENSTDAINGSQFFGILQHLTTDPVYFYGADDSTAGKIVGKKAEEKSADAHKKKVVARSMADSRLDLKGGATGELTDNNIGVVYGDERTIKFKLAKELSGLTSAEFKDANNNVVNITPTGVSLKKPNATDANTVTLSQNGLNNGGNAITNVAGNLEGAKLNSTAPTTSATAPTLGTGINEVNKNNVATVGDVLEAGWNLQNNSTEKDFVKPYDTVNFADGNGTTAVVDTIENKTSTVKYNVNVGNGLEKNSANQITIKPADTSLEVTKDGVKVKTDGTTITTDPTNGLKVVTGGIEAGTTPGTVKVTDGDNNKIATVDSVVDAVNNAAFTLKASAIEGGTRNTGSTVTATGESIKAGSTIEMIAGKNLEVTHNKNGKIIFATVDNPSFNTVQVGNSEGPKFSATADGNIRVSDKDDTNPVKITNVKDGEISKTSKDAINGSQFHKLANNTIKLAGQNGDDASGETEPQNLNQKDGIKFTVKSSDGTLLDVTAANDTITLAPKTGTITTTDGVPTAVTKNGKLVTVDEVVKALKDLGWKATAGTDGTGTMIGDGATEELIKAGNTVTFKAGDNLSIKQDGKNFIYSLNPALTGLTSAEFKDGDNKVKITPTGITITKPAGTTENTVTLNQNGLNNGGNPITNVAGNLQGAKAGTDAPTTNATAPTLGAGADEVNKNNAATVGDVLNAGWNLQEKGVAKDFVKPYDTVNFIDGDGTSVAVATTNDGRTSTVKYSVNLGNGLEKTTDNKITVKPADKSLEVTTAGLKAKTDNTTITTGDSGLKVVTGGIKEDGNNPGTVKVTEGDTGKIATVDSVVDAVNSAAFTLKASAIEGGTRNTNSTVAETGESIKAGNTIEMIAGKNLNVTHNTNGKITFATVENPSFNTVQIGNSEGPKFSATADGNIKVSDKDDTKPVKITNVADGTISDSSKDAINGSQIHKLVNKAIKLAGQNGNDTSGETEPQNLTQQDPIKFTVKSSDGKLLEVTAGGDTITLTPKTGTITTTDGVPTATTTNGKLVTADEVVKALTEMGWKATAGTEGTGTMIGAAATEELIKAGNTVTFKAGDNLSIKQDGKNFIYSLKTDLKDLTSAEFKDANNNTVKITPNGVSFKKPNATDADTVTLNQNGLNNGGNPITNVAGNLQGAKAGTDAPTTNATAPSLGTGTDQVNKNNAATVGDVLNAGWNLQNNDAAKDFVKPYDTVNFVNGEGTTAVVETTDQTTSKIKYNVNTGKGLEKTTDNKITVKPGDKSLEVTDDGLKVKTDNTTIKTGDTGLTVNTGTINKVTEGNTAGTVVAKTGDENKIATVSNVVEAINNAAWTATSAATTAGELGAAATNQLVKAGDKVTFEADKNIKITQDAGKFTFATKDNVTFETVQVGGDQGPKFSKSAAGDIKVSGSDNTTPVKITNVKDGEISETSTDAINGSQFHKLANNTITLQGQTGDAEKSSTKAQNLDTKDGIKFTVKSSNGDLLEVTAAEDTITITPKTATITTGKDGIPTANTDGGKLVTADQLVTALTEMGWKATAGTDGTGTMIGAGATEELIKAGNTVTFKAGDNLSIKQDGKNFIYSLNPALTGLTSAEFKEGDNKVKITPTGITITKPADPTAGTPENTVTLNQNGLNNGGNPITNVTSNLVNYSDPDVNGKAPVRNELRKFDNNAVPNTNVATVGDLRNMGWVVSSNKTTGDLGNPYSETVKNADEVKFVGTGLATVSGKTENGVRTITVDVESKTAINAVTYTKTDGTKVYPVEGPTGTTYHTTPEGNGPNDETVDGSNVITSVNGPKGTKTPSTLSNVAGNLDGAKAGTDAPTTKHDAPNTTEAGQPNYVNTHNAATVGDVLQAGWNLQNNSVEKDFVKPYDTVNFADGNGTTAVVDTTDNKISTVKYNVNLGNGLVKNDDNQITVKPADSSLVVDAAGVKVNTGTINNVTTGDKPGTVAPNTDDDTKLATVGNVVNAINNAAWTATSAATTAGELGAAATNQLVKAGDKVTFEADKNIKITQDAGKFTFATKDNVTFETVQVGGDQGPKFSKSAAGDIKVSGSDNTTPVKITNVKDGEISETSTDAINGSQFHKLANNTITLQGQTGDAEKSSTKAQNLDTKDGIKFTVKSSNGDLLEVTAAEDTITITPKTATITTGKDGIPTANTDGGKLVTADQLVTALTEMGWKATAGTDGTGTMIGAGATEELIKAGNTVTFKAGDNLSIKQDGKNFIYSLNPALTGLTSAEFKEGDNKVKITPTGITITKPADPTAGTPENTVTLNQNGLNNGGNPITNVGGNLDGAKAGTEAPTTKHDAPNTTEAGQPNYVNTHNAATVGDVLQAGWNLQNNSVEKDFVKPYDTVNFADGNGTTAVVDTTDNKISTVKYNVNLGNGLAKNDDNQITVKPADSSLVVDAAGVKVNTGTINNVTTGDKPGTVAPNTDDDTKLATVGNVVNAINNAAWTATSAATTAGELGAAATNQLVKAGDKVTFEADKNIKITQDAGKFTFATKDNVTFETVQVGGDQGPKFSKSAAGDIKVSGSDNTTPVKITNVKDGEISETSTDAINGSQFHKLANNTITLQGQTGDAEKSSTKAQNLDTKDGIKFTVKSSNGDLLEVTAAEDTITITPKTATITTGKDGIPTANTDGGKLVTADQLVTALTEMGWKATAGTDGTGTMIGAGATEELIKAGNTVTFKAGDNLSIKQDGKNFIYSLNPALTGLTSAEFKEGDNKVKITPTGITITKPADPTAGTPENTVTLNQNGLNNGGNPITNVGGNLDGAKAGTEAPTTKHDAPNTTEAGQPNYVNTHNAATVGDVLQAGWNLQNNSVEKDFVKPYDTVNFADGNGTTAVVDTTDNKISTVKYNVNLGNGLAKNDDNQITVKPADSSLVVDAAGVKVNTGTINNVTTGDKPGTVAPNTDDDTKLATVGNVVNAINNAAWTATSAATTAGELGAAATNQLVKAGDKVTFEADKNIKITQDAGKFTFATKDNVTFETVQVGGDQGPKFSKSAAGDIKVSGSDNTTPVKITNVKDGEISETSTDAINGSQFHKLANNTITLQGQTGDAEKSSTKAQNLDTKDGIKFTVKSSNGDLLEVTAAEDTITITPKTATITTGKDGIPTANTDGGKLVTADQLVTALTEMGWKATAGTDGTGTMIGAGATEELIKAGNTVTFKAGDNLSIKQDGKNFIYSLNPALTGLTSAEFKEGDNKVKITPTGITITKPADPTAGTPENTVTLNQNGLNNGGNPITNVGGNLDGAKAGTEAPTTKHDAPNTTEAGQPNYVNTHNAATVGDVLQAGWNLQNNSVEKDFVKPYDTVNFVNGLNTTAVVSTVDGTTSHVTYNVTGLPVTYTTSDGTPVSKIGDKFYKVNDKGQPIDEQGNPSTKVNNNGEPIDGNGNVINAIDTAANPLKTSLVNPAPEANKTGTTSPTTLDNVTSKLANYSDPDVNGKAPVRNNLVDLSKPENGQPNVSDNTVATVGDLRNMGWIVSSDKTTDDLTKDYSDTVKNANEVKFVGEGTAIVSGKTDDKGVRTITVKVDDQTSTNNSVTPIVYTKADGTQVYPTNKKDDQGHPIFNTKADGSGVEVPGTDVVTSVNGPNGTKGDKAPTTLKNVKNNIPNVNDGSKTITNPDGTEKAGDVENINKAPLTAEDAAKLSNPKTADGAANPKYIGNNAATVSDVLNAGWNLQNNGTAKDFVKPYDTVNFINGLGTTAVVTTREGSTTSDVTFNVKAANGSVTVDEDGVKVTTGEMKPEVGADNKETGAIATPVDPTTAKQLKDTLDAAVKELATAKDALKTAETALAAKPNDPALQKDVEDKKAQVAEKQTPVNKAQKAHDDAGLNKVATVQNVAEAINNSGFNLKTSADGGEKLTTGSKNDGELIKPGNTVEMVAGNNLTVKQDEHGKITYATKDDVTFKTVDTGTLNVGSPNTYTDGKGNTYTKVGENYYKPADVENGVPKQGATPVDVTTTPVTPVSPVTMKAEAAKPATNNATDAQPSSALNVTSKDGKPTQITGVGSTLNTKSVDTTPAGTAPGTTPNTTPANLIDLEGTADAPVNKNAAATVGDLQNMGWVVSAKDGNGYKDVVKNANVVDFKGDQGVTVTGKTLADGTREITVGIKEGEVTNKVTITHGDGSKTDAVKIGDNYYKVDKDGKPVGFDKDENGKPAGTPLTINPTEDKVTNNGAGFVTGNTVANAIQDSGWNVGIGSTDKDFSKDEKVYDKVNPNDDVKFSNGANTNVSMVTVDALNEDGTKKATTYVKVDINRDLKIDSVTTGGTATDKNGNNLVKVGDQYYKEGDVTIVTNPDGTTTVTPKENAKAVPPADVIPPKDGAMIVKNADGKDVVSATVGKDGNGAFGINGKDGKNGISMTAKDGQGTIGVNGKDGKSTTIAGDTITIKDKDNNATNIGVNTITLVDKAGNTTTTTADKSEIKDAAGNINANTATGNTLKDPNGNTHTSTASTSELKDKDGNTNTSTPTTNVLKDTNGNTNTSAATGTTYKDKDENKTVVGPKEINISDKSGENTASLTNKDLLLNAKDPNTGVDKTSHVSGDKIAFTTTDEMEKVVDKDGKPVIDPATGKQKEVVKMEKVFDKDGKPVIDPATGKQKEVVKNPGNSTEYTNEGLKVIPNSTVARDVNGNPTFLDKDGKPVMKDTDGKYKYVGQDGKPGDKYDGSVGVLKPNVVDNTRVISFGMDKPVLDKNGKPVTGPDGNPVMTEGISAGMQQIHNVAPGTKDTDAVNVSQLRGTTININNRVNRVGAQAAALAGLQSIQYDPLEPTQISAGVGYYQGASALALGMNHYKNESTMFHVGASVNGNMNEVMANASVTWKFGARADETAVKDTFRQGPISASYTLQDKVSALEAQNQIQKDQLEELKALNAKQQEQIAELFKRLSEKA